MSTPEQMIEAQRIASRFPWLTDPHIITPDTLAALLRERDELQQKLHALRLVCGTTDAEKFTTWLDRAIQQRDQWRECAEALADSLRDLHDRSNALARFDALKAQEAGK